MSSKLGRKGDPRMHRAVAARMENPNLSLYDALCIGGFDYSENDDKSVLDSKQVTLGQRKNQLSRRLRLARKQKAGALKKPPPGSPASVDSQGERLSNGSTEIQNGTNMLSSGISGTHAHAHAHAQTKPAPIHSPQKPQPQPLHPTPLNGRTKDDFINELAAGALMNNNNNNNNRNGSNGGPASKRQRFTCVTTPAANSKLNLNHSLCQGWMLNKMSTDDVSNAMLGSGPTLGQGPSMHYPPSGLYYNPQIPTNRSVARYQTGSSAVALSSLAASAQAVGLTLDQLALTLSSNTTSLNKLVQEARSGESEIKQEQMALDLFQADVKALYTKCLLMAGVDASLAKQSTPTYIKFATKAWEAEGQRLRTIRNAMNSVKEPKQLSITFDESTFYQSNGNHSQHSNGTPNSRSSKSSKDNHNHNGSNGATATNLDWTNPVNHSQCSHDNGDHNHDHEHEHDHNREHDHEHNHHGTNGNKGDCNGSEKHQSASYNGSEKHDSTHCDSRHFHRLGECGHKAIIHKPKDGPPHIDFIVNDQIECYQGTDTLSLAGSSLAGRSEKSIETIWPSKYRCKEVDDGGGSAAKSCGSRVEPAFLGIWNHLEPLVQEPKVFKLSEINASDPEWTLDATEDVDGGVMGLFELGRDPSTEVTNI